MNTHKLLTGLAVLCGLTLHTQAQIIWVRDSLAANISIYHGATAQVAKVDVGVWPVEPGHTVGAVYTPDNWQSVRWTPSHNSIWVTNARNAFGSWDEQWRLLLTGRSGFGLDPRSTWRFAVYVDTPGRPRVWNNNGGRDHSVSITRWAPLAWMSAGYKPGSPLATDTW